MLKVMPWPWLSVSKQIWFKSFKWGTVRPCWSRGCKKLEVDKKLPTQPDSMRPGPGWSGRFFWHVNFELLYFCSLLTYKDVQYLIWKIWFISVLRLKAKVMAWLLIWFIFTQSTLISYHTEAFVKTEVGCTVDKV